MPPSSESHPTSATHQHSPHRRTSANSAEGLTSERGRLIITLRDHHAQRTKVEKLLQPLVAKVPVPGGEDALLDELKGRARTYREHVIVEAEASKRKAEAERTATATADQTANLEQKIGKLLPLPADPEFGTMDIEDLPPVAVAVADAEESYSSAVRERLPQPSLARGGRRHIQSA